MLRAWLSAGFGYQLKFVASAPDDLDEIAATVASVGLPVPAAKILVMPEARTLETMRERAAWLGEACKARGWRYAHRLHVELYGNRRGT